jgi:hypothetical protein
MRRVVWGFIVASGLVLGPANPVWAHAPSPSPPSTSESAAAGTAVCKITDPKVTEVSGIVATATGFAVINDSNPTQSREKIFMLDSACKVTAAIGYPTPARDPEDIAQGKDGTLWSADIGDNAPVSGGSGNRRTSIALWSLAPGAQEPVIHRLVYPDGQARDAEALLLAGNGTPVIVTKDPVGEVYVPDGPLQTNNTQGVKLKKVGVFTPAKTGTANPLSFLGEGLITGGAVSPDGTKAVVRTMSDAYEFDVAGGDVAKALTSGKPRITPLANEPQGEGISFTADGKSYLTCSDQSGASAITRYAPTSAPLSKSTAGANVASPQAKEKSFMKSLTLQDITYFVAGIGILGLILVVAGVLGIRKSRTKRRAAGPGSAVYGSGSGRQPLDNPDRSDAGDEPVGNVYGSGRPPTGPPPGAGQGAVPPRSGGRAQSPRSGGRGRAQTPPADGGTVYGGAGGGYDQQPPPGRQGYDPDRRRDSPGRGSYQADPHGRRR